MGSSTVKKKFWGFVGYPESLPENWLDVLKQSGLQFAVSPLHEFDTDPATGELKKPHYHFILVYSNTTTFNNVKNFVCGQLNSPIPIPLESVRGYYRYFTHLDNPDKYQYDEKGIQCYNGFAIQNHTELTHYEVSLLKRKLCDIIKQEKLLEYADLIDYCVYNEFWDLFDTASSHTIFFARYLDSIRSRCARKELKGW